MDAKTESVTVHAAALELVQPGSTVAVGSGPLVEVFVQGLAAEKGKLEAVVAASPSTAGWLETLGLPVREFNDIDDLDLFVAEPRAFTRHLTHVYAASRALAAERVLAAAARRYLCLARAEDEARVLDAVPVPVEVIDMARSFVSRALAKLGALPEWQERARSEAGNPILLARNLDLTDPYAVEDRLDEIPGIVGHGLVTRRPASLVLVQDGAAVRRLVGG